MSKQKKRIARLRQGKDITPDELDTIMTHDLGCTSRQPGTSHKTYRHPDGRKITIPQDRPHIKRAYVDQVCDMFDEELAEIENA